MPALRIKLPDSAETTHLLKGDRVSVGRSPDNTIQIAHASISSHHAELVAVNGRYSLRDLQSTNRSYVEGKPVTECDLRGPCTILFGSVECEFDPAVAPKIKRAALPAPPRASLPANLVHLESENRELRERVHALQRHFDILGPARLSTGKSKPELPEAKKSLSAERDEARQENTLLKLEVEALREEVAMLVRERNAAREAAQAQLPAASRLDLPAAPNSAGAPSVDVDSLACLVRNLQATIEAWALAPADLSRTVADAVALAEATESLGSHPFRRIARGLRELLQNLAGNNQPPLAATLRSVRGAADFLGLLLEPSRFADGEKLPVGQVLVIDDDADLLGTVTDALMTAHLDVTGCLNAEDALAAVEAQRFDTIVADVMLPGMNGPAFCARTRELPAYRRTPILFLTAADTVDARAETSLSGGNEFLAKPFNVYELAVKVETWVLRQQLRML